MVYVPSKEPKPPKRQKGKPGDRRWVATFDLHGAEHKRDRLAKRRNTVEAWVIRKYPDATNVRVETYRG